MTFRSREAPVVAALAAISAFAQAAAFNNVRFDDAYVTFRYSQNLANGSGFVFNPGEHVLGTTSPGHALLGAVFYAWVGKIPFPAVMDAIGCVGWTAQAVCVYALLRDVVGRAGAALVAIAIAVGASRPYFWLPLETNVTAALVLAAFVLAARRSWTACGVVGGLAVLFRADALLACAVLGFLALREEGARAWRPAASFAVVTGAWSAFALAYFGTVVPHTPHLGHGHGALAEYAKQAIAYPALSVAPWSRVVDSSTHGSWLTIVPAWGLAGAGAVLLGRRSRTLGGLAVYGLLLTLAYVALRPDVVLRWHVYQVTLLLAVFAISALVLLAQRLRIPRLVAAPAACALLAGFALETVFFEIREPLLPTYGMRDCVDHTVASYLAASAAPADYVSAAEVGTVAYLSGLPMVDSPGVLSDDAAAQLSAATDGQPSRVRWGILSHWEAKASEAAFARFGRIVFEEGKVKRIVYDLRAPSR